MSSPASSGQSSRASSGVIIRDGTPSSFCSATLRLNASTSRLGGEHEEVADLLVVDLPARPLLEALVGLQAALGDLDVQRVGELRAQTARGLRRRAAGQLVALEQDDLRSGLGEVERGADAHDASAHDHDVGTGRQRLSAACRRW